MRAIAIAAFLALAGCAAPQCPAPPPAAAPPAAANKPVDLTAMCGTVAPLDDQELAQAFAGLPDNSPLIFAIGDYKRMRDEARACLAATHQ